jgi:hypothetical protein
MTRGKHARIMADLDAAKRSREKASGRVDSQVAAARGKIPGYDPNKARRDAMRGWVDVQLYRTEDVWKPAGNQSSGGRYETGQSNCNSRFGCDTSNGNERGEGSSGHYEARSVLDRTIRLPRSAVEAMQGKLNSKYNPRWVNGRTFALNTHKGDKKGMDIWGQLVGAGRKAEAELNNALKEQQAAYNTQVAQANREINAASREAHGQIDAMGAADQASIDSWNRNAKDQRNTARETALSLAMGGKK